MNSKLKEILNLSQKIENQSCLYLRNNVFLDFENTATYSEKNINNIIRNSFLNFWTIPNPFSYKGKELCDVLIIFQNNVIIISDKEREFKETTFSKNIEDINKKWKNFYKGLRKSKKQLLQAKDWLLKNPEEIYFDNMCNNKVPIKLDIKKLNFYLITTVSNWKDVANFYCENEGFLKINTSNQRSPEHKTLILNNIYDELTNNFYHMIDNVALEKILQSLNTIPDFIDYLIFKEIFFKDCLSKSIIIKSNSEINIMNQYKLDFLYNNLPNISLTLNNNEYNFNLFDFNLLLNHDCNKCYSLSTNSEKLLDSIISILITNEQNHTFEEEKSLRKACELIFSLNRNSRTVISNSIKNILLKSEINNQSYSLLVYNNNYAFFIIIPYSNKELNHDDYKSFMSTNLSSNLLKFIKKNQSNLNFKNLEYLIGLSISNINFELEIVSDICFLLENWQSI